MIASAVVVVILFGGVFGVLGCNCLARSHLNRPIGWIRMEFGNSQMLVGGG